MTAIVARLRGIVAGWSSATGYGWVAASGRTHFLHVEQLRGQQPLVGAVVEFEPIRDARGWAAIRARVLPGAPLPPVGDRVCARVLQVVSPKGLAVVVADGERRAVAMFRDFCDVMQGEPLAEGDVLEGDIVDVGQTRWRLMSVRVVKYANRRS